MLGKPGTDGCADFMQSDRSTRMRLRKPIPKYEALTFALVRLSSLNTPAFLGHTNMPVYPGALRLARNASRNGEAAFAGYPPSWMGERIGDLTLILVRLSP